LSLFKKLKREKEEKEREREGENLLVSRIQLRPFMLPINQFSACKFQFWKVRPVTKRYLDDCSYARLSGFPIKIPKRSLYR
jgi:hypothetical protein